jgi:Uma2 family endonuclease
MKMAIPAVRRDSHFTYGDYKLWPEDERWELIEGVAYEMAGPSLPHQSAVGELYFRLRTFLEGKRCAVFVAPLDILLPSSESQDDEEVDTVVQPDVVVFCDPDKLRYGGARGAPDLAIEVLSPWNLRHDLDRKFRLYEKAGVREYWIVDPANRGITAFTRQGDGFDEGDYRSAGQTLSSSVLAGFEVVVAQVFLA